MKALALLLLVASSWTCEGEARGLMRRLAAVVSAVPDAHGPLLAATCAELSGCARGCERELVALPSSAASDRTALLRSCADYSRFIAGVPPAQIEARTEQWVRDRVLDFGERIRGRLGPADRHRLDCYRSVLGAGDPGLHRTPACADVLPPYAGGAVEPR